MSKESLIMRLSNAFVQEEKESHSTVISAVAGEQDVLRLLTNYDNSSEKMLHQNHPDVRMVELLIDDMTTCGLKEIEIVGRELIVKFNTAVKTNNEPKITEIVAACRNVYLNMRGVPATSMEKMMHYMVAVDTVKKL